MCQGEALGRTAGVWLLLLLLLLLAGAEAGFAQDAPEPEKDRMAPAADGREVPAAPAVDQPLRFRRVLVPENSIAEVAGGHMPLKRDRFTEYVERIQAASNSNRGITARISQAEYYARLDAGQLVDGKALLSVEMTEPEPRLVALTPCGLALEPLTAPAATAENGPPSTQLGVAADGRLWAYVKRPGKIALAWSLRGQSQEGEGWRFPVEVPQAPTSRLWLDVPSAWKLEAEDGLVTVAAEIGDDVKSRQGAESRQGEAEPGNADPRRPTSLSFGDWWRPAEELIPDADPPDEHRRWLVELGGSSRTTLRVTPDERGGAGQRRPQLRQEILYVLKPAGVEVRAELRLDVPQPPQRRLKLLVDEALQITSVEFRGEQLAWNATSERRGRRRVVELEFAEGVCGTDCLLRVEGLSPLALGDRQRLPTIAVENAVWREGTARLEVAESLLVRQILSQGCHEVPAEPASAAGGPDRRRFQCYRPDWTLALDAVVRPLQLRLESGLRLRPTDTELTAEFAGRFLAQQGVTFQLEATFPASWEIDDVRLVPSDALASYEVLPPSGAASQKQLLVRLARSIAADREVELRIRSHRSSDLHQPLRAADFRLWSFAAVQQQRHLVAVETVDRQRLELGGDLELKRLDAEELPERERALLGESPPGLVFLDDMSADGLRIEQTRVEPEFSVAIRLLATVHEDRVVEESYLTCSPESGPLRRLIVHVSQRSDSPWRWSVRRSGGGGSGAAAEPVGERTGPGAPEQVAEGNSPARDPLSVFRAQLLEAEDLGAGEVWEVELSEPVSEPFVLVARRTTPNAGEFDLGLMAVHAAASQTGEIEVLAGNGAAVRVAQRQATLLPTASLPWDRYTTARAWLRYEPSRGGRIRVAAASKDAPTAMLWAWNYVLSSQVAPHGVGSHRAVLQLENTGANAITLEVPEGVAVNRWEIDGRVVDEALIEKSDGEMRCPLPAGSRFPTLVMEFTTRSAPWGNLPRLQLQVPRPKIPVLDRHWQLRIPAAYGLLTGTPGYESLEWKPQSWLERLLGPFAASNPDSSLLLRSAWNAWRGEPDGPRRGARSLFSMLESRLRAFGDNESSPLTWGTLLRDSGDPLRDAGFRLLLDEPAMLAAGIGAEDHITALPGDLLHGSSLARSLLFDRGLVVLAAGETLLLTTSRMRPVYADHLASTDDPLVSAVRTDSLLYSELQRTERRSERFLDTASWSSGLPPPPGLWTLPSEQLSPIDSVGWTMHALEFSTQEPLRCRLYRRSLIQASGWIALLMAAGGVCWLCRAQPARLFLVIGLAAGAALWVPPLLVPLFSGVFLGCGLAGLGLLAWNRVGRPGIPGELSSGPTGSSVLTSRWPLWLVAVIVSAALSRGVVGQEQNSVFGEKSARGPVYRVLIPVDEERQPVGDHDYLPLPFYEALLRRAATARAAPQGWLIESARYEADLNLEGAVAEPELEELTATYQFVTFETDQNVRLNLPRRHLELAAAHLDGKPLQVVWRQDGSHLEVRVARAGKHELELSLRPLVRQFGTRRGIEIQLPKLSRSVLELRVFGDARRVEVLDTRGAVRLDKDVNRLRAGLGPTDKLHVQWSAEAPPQAPMDVAADELLWLRVKPSSVVVEALFRLTSRTAALDTITLRADPRLRLLRVDPPLAARPVIRLDQRKTLVLKLAEPSRREVVLRASFILEDSSGIGNIGLPELEVVADRSTRRWLAVTLAPPLELSAARVPEAFHIPADEFSAAWGGDAELPQFACDLASRAADWSLATRFRDVRTRIDQQLRISATAQSLRVRFEGQLLAGANLAYQQLFAVPRDLRVQRVILQEADRARDLEFAGLGGGRLAVFLAGVAAPEARLVIEGRIALGPRGTLPLPMIRLEQAEVRSQRVEVYRRADALVRVDDVRGLEADREPWTEAYRKGWGRMVARLVSPTEQDETAPRPADGDEVSGRLRIAPNQPHRNARLIVTLQRRGGGWRAEVDYAVRVKNGLLDALRLEIPPEWTDAPSLPAEIPHEVRPLPGSDRRQLIVYPPAAVHDEYRVRMQGELPAGAGADGTLPDLVPLNVEEAERYVVLPTRHEQGRIEWKPSGLQPSVMPRERSDLSPDEFTAYRIVSPRPRAAIRQVNPVAENAHVGLADIFISWRRSGACQGVATFDLEPANQRTVTLHLPAPYRLVHARVAGVPAYVERQGGDEFDIQLGPERLPQRIEVLFTGQLQPGRLDGETWRLPAPRLRGLQVERTLWTVRTPGDAQPRALHAESLPSALVLEKWRLNNSAGLIERTVGLLDDRRQQEIDHWYGDWGRRLVDDAGRVRRAGRIAADEEAYDPAAMVELNRRQRQIAERLKTTPLWDAWLDAGPRPARSSDAWRAATEPFLAVTYAASGGKAEALELEMVRHQSPQWGMRTAVTLAILLFTGLAYTAFSRGWIQPLVAQWPHLGGVLLGLVWWLFLWPAFLGWLIVAVSLLAVFRKPWKAALQTAPSSTVIRRDSNF